MHGLAVPHQYNAQRPSIHLCDSDPAGMHLSCWVASRLRKGALATGAARKKAMVAVARQLAVDLWRLRTARVNAATLGLI